MRNGFLIILFSCFSCLIFAGPADLAGPSSQASASFIKKKHSTSETSMLAKNSLVTAAEFRLVKNLLDAATLPPIITLHEKNKVLVISFTATDFYSKSYLAHIYPSLHYW